MRSRMLTFVSLAVLVCLYVGCKPDNPLNRQAVSGTVTYNGKPAPQGSLTFMPVATGNTVSGTTIKDGQYRIAQEKGLAPGEYAVAVRIPDPDWTPDKGLEPEEAAPREWTTEGKHKVTVTEAGPNEFQFDVVRTDPVEYKP